MGRLLTPKKPRPLTPRLLAPYACEPNVSRAVAVPNRKKDKNALHLA